MGDRPFRCPICKAPVAREGKSRTRHFPFCTERCRLIDLGQWFAEDYRIAANDSVDIDVDRNAVDEFGTEGARIEEPETD